MANSPAVDSDNVVRVTVRVGGTSLSEGTQILSVTVRKTVNSISRARIVLVDGDLDEHSFPLSDGDDLIPGEEVEISAGYGDSSDETLFKGVIVSHALRISGENDTRLILECRDQAIKLTDVRRNATFLKRVDSDVFKAILEEAGLEADVEATTVEYSELIQHYSTDWDFLLTRAEANGFVVITDDGTVRVGSPDVSASPVLEVTYGDDLIEFDAQLDARYQRTGASGVSWNPTDQQLTSGEGASPATNGQGNLSATQLGDVISSNPWRLQTAARYPEAAMKQWASAQRTRTALARLRGHLKFQGNAMAKPGVLIECKGVGERFEGDAYVASVEHTLSDGDWLTEVQMGLSPEAFAERVDIEAPRASGLAPGIDGLQIGKVMQLDQDPDGEYRLAVQLPLLQTGDEAVWARLSSLYASNSFGVLFVPEVGDEVVLGFLNGDVGQPVILGSLYSSKSFPTPYEITADNFIKALVTREQMKLEFDEEKKIITLITPAANKVVIDDDAKSITLLDETGNSITLDPGGITLDSPKDIAIKATGNVSVDAGGEVSISATSDLTAQGLNVTASADASLKATGSASAELSASGQTTVKGAMVLIN